MRYYLNLDPYQYDKLFEETKGSYDYLNMVLNLTEFMLFWNGNPPQNTIPYVCVDDGIIKRAFLVGQDKIISFHYNIPFRLKVFNGIPYLEVTWKGENVTSKNLSEARSIVNEMKEKPNYLYVGNDVDDIYNGVDELTYQFFEQLILMEPSYIRYDHDTKIPDSQIHPTNHFDVNYSQESEYKIGLDHRIDLNEFIDIIDKSTRCRILQ